MAMRIGRHEALLLAALVVLVLLFCSMQFGVLRDADFVAKKKETSAYSYITEFLHADPEGGEAPLSLYQTRNIISRQLFFAYQVGNVGDYVMCYEELPVPAAYSETHSGIAGYRVVSSELNSEYRGESEEGYSYITVDVELENACGYGGLFDPKLCMALMKEDGSFEENFASDFEPVDIVFDGEVNTYAVYSEVMGDRQSGNLGYVRCDDWETFGFSVYLAEGERVSFSCVFRLRDEDAGRENLVLGKDDSAAAFSFGGEVAYSNYGFRIYLNK